MMGVEMSFQSERDIPGACCIKCYELICSQESYEFQECYTRILKIRRILGYELISNILYNRPLDNKCNLSERSSQQPVSKRLLFLVGREAARGKGSTIDPINRDLFALPSPLRQASRSEGRQRGGTDGRTAEKFSHQTMRRRCRVVVGC